MITAIIPAKGGSKRLPNKNIQKLNGKNLLDYAFIFLRKSKKVNNFYVTTDDDYIENYCIEKRINVIRRPNSLGGETPLMEVYKHFLTQIDFADKIKILLGVQVDHPDRRLSIDEVLDIFLKEEADRLFSKDKKGKKNGAHYILSKFYLDGNKSRKDVTVIDDCTNIHYREDLLTAEKFLSQ